MLAKGYLETREFEQHEDDHLHGPGGNGRRPEGLMNEAQVRWRKLKLLSKYHICQVAHDLMQQASIDAKIWEPYLQKFVVQAVDSVKPSCRYLKDSMDFNRYVDVQLIDYKDETRSRYVNGCVLLKNLAEKRMPHEIHNPKILLLRGSLGFMKNFED